MYPQDAVARQDLADALTAAGFKPRQPKSRFSRATIEAMAIAMKSGQFAWNRSAMQPAILGPNGEVLGGHHRVIAACLAGIDLKAIPGQVYSIAPVYRPVYDWIDVLPDVR